jgi:SAM-dependent methyltransferase
MHTPLDQALEDYINGEDCEDIVIESDLAEDDVMEVAYYFRSENQLPLLEKIALKNCKGKILDVGACVGAHTIPLVKKGLDVTALDTSKVAMDFLAQKDVKAFSTPFLAHQGQKYDTILLLMNGIGLAESLNDLPLFLKHCYDLLEPNGCVICDSTDVSYFFEDEDGAKWIDLNAAYYGEFSFRMKYKGIAGEWFKWVYLDQETLKQYAEKIGFKVILIHDDPETNMFLFKLIK